MIDSPRDTVDGIPLLETKLYIPGRRHNLVSRPRLIERMNQGIERKLTLISAPAGFGKTTVLAEWLSETSPGQRPTGWVSLDPSDSDPVLFWSYVITALQNVEPDVGETALSLLWSSQRPPMESVLTPLVNDLNAVEDDFVFVLDDYHVIEAEPVDDALAFLIEHQPPHMHLVIATREDPDLPLPRLRAKSQITELRAEDLRFTSSEATQFLNRATHLDLSSDDIDALESRTEGWIAGLQLAALSMRGREDVHGFIESFTGSHRFVMDYLVQEVLDQQPEHVRTFLLRTSILDRLCGSLCEAVTEQEEGAERLAALEQGNLFVVPLDDRRRWYRYHHLFANVLQAQLMAEQPDRVPALHRRASDWYEQNGLRPDAIRHALAAEDVERAAGLIERAWPAMDEQFQAATWLGWVKALPDEVVSNRPVLSFAYAWALINEGDLEAGKARLRDAERWLDTSGDSTTLPEDPSSEMVVVDEEQFRSLPASMAAMRAYLAQARGDVSATVQHARRSLELSDEEDHTPRGQTGALLGLAHWTKGELNEAYAALDDAMANFRKAGKLHFANAVVYGLADIRIVQGRLHEAVRVYERALQRSKETGDPFLRGTSGLHLGLAEIYCEQGDLSTAKQQLRRSNELGEQFALPDWPHRFRRVQARITEIQGDLHGALELLDEAERLNFRSPVPEVRPIPARKARIRIAQGRLAEAEEWVRERGLSVDDDLSFLREFEHVTLARVLIARHDVDGVERSIHKAVELLDRLLQAAEEGGRTGSVIEILMLQALAHQALGDTARALDSLERALTLAEPEDYVRVFVGEGETMRDLLRHAAADGIGGVYTRRLLDAFEEPAPSEVSADRLARPLTPREIEILRLIAAGLKNQEIADQLFISLATVKRHISNAYGKMDVRNRTEAVALARELDLL